MEQKLNASLVTCQKKDGSGTYQCVVIQLTPTYSKKVFLESAELELLKLQSNNNNNNDNLPFEQVNNMFN